MEEKSFTEDYEKLIEKEEKKLKAKRILTKVGIGIGMIVAGVIGYKIGYRDAYITTAGIVVLAADDDPKYKDKFIKAWDNGVDKYFTKKK